ncbi:MAG: hypothetical protein WCV50_01155 [Patescibacteria group bacterium]|jgi:hypothetical protein
MEKIVYNNRYKTIFKRFWWVILFVIFALAAACLFIFSIYRSGRLSNSNNSNSAQTVAASQRDQIENEYPEFRNFENQVSFAGNKVKEIQDGDDLYIAYLVLGSGLPIAQATCFHVDSQLQVYKIGIFPDPLDSYLGYADVDPKTCKGIK